MWVAGLVETGEKKFHKKILLMTIVLRHLDCGSSNLQFSNLQPHPLVLSFFPTSWEWWMLRVDISLPACKGPDRFSQM